MQAIILSSIVVFYEIVHNSLRNDAFVMNFLYVVEKGFSHTSMYLVVSLKVVLDDQKIRQYSSSINFQKQITQNPYVIAENGIA